jgi:magnesium transporter
MDTDQILLEKFIQNHSGEVLHFIEKLGAKEIAGLIESLPLQLSEQLFNQMDRYKASQCLENLNPEMAIKLIDALHPSLAATILRQVNKDLCNSLLDDLSKDKSKSIAKILSYPDNTIGAYLDPLVFTLYEDLSVEQGLTRIRESHPNIISPVSILSRNPLLVGFKEVNDLITTEITKQIHTVMNPNPPEILADINIKALLAGRDWDNSFYYLPVVDSTGVFLGVIGRDVLKNIDQKAETLDRHAQEASMALGDLFQIGLTSLFRSTSDIIWDYKQKP